MLRKTFRDDERKRICEFLNFTVIFCVPYASESTNSNLQFFIWAEVIYTRTTASTYKAYIDNYNYCFAYSSFILTTAKTGTTNSRADIFTNEIKDIIELIPQNTLTYM